MKAGLCNKRKLFIALPQILGAYPARDVAQTKTSEKNEEVKTTTIYTETTNNKKLQRRTVNIAGTTYTAAAWEQYECRKGGTKNE